MNNLELAFPQDSTGFDPGTEISIIASWEFDAPPEVLEVRLVWNTAGKGDQDLKVVKVARLEKPAAKEQRSVVLELPWGPYSFSGKLISLIWAIELVALPDKDSLRKEIRIAPQGNEVLISQ